MILLFLFAFFLYLLTPGFQFCCRINFFFYIFPLQIRLSCRAINAIRFCASEDSRQFARWFTTLNPSSFTVTLGPNEALSLPYHGSRTWLRNFRDIKDTKER